MTKKRNLISSLRKLNKLLSPDLMPLAKYLKAICKDIPGGVTKYVQDIIKAKPNDQKRLAALKDKDYLLELIEEFRDSLGFQETEAGVPKKLKTFPAPLDHKELDDAVINAARPVLQQWAYGECVYELLQLLNTSNLKQKEIIDRVLQLCQKQGNEVILAAYSFIKDKQKKPFAEVSGSGGMEQFLPGDYVQYFSTETKKNYFGNIMKFNPTRLSALIRWDNPKPKDWDKYIPVKKLQHPQRSHGHVH